MKRFCVNGHDTKVVGRDSARRCRECERERGRVRDATAARKALKTSQARARRRAIAASLRVFKLAKGCLLCGSRDDLEFHHRLPAKKKTLVPAARTWASMKAEIVKCDVLCVDCHRLVTWGLPGDVLALSAVWIPD